MRRKDLQQTYRRDDAAAQAALESLRRRQASGVADPDPFDTADGLPELPEAEDAVVAELRPPQKS